MPDERENQKDEDESITEALSSLGWVEEKEEAEKPIAEEESLKEQLDYFIEQNTQLNDKILKISEELKNLKKDYDLLFQEKEKFQQMVDQNNSTIENLLQTIVQKDDAIKELESKVEVVSQSSDLELNEIIEDKDKEIGELKKQLEEFKNSSNEKLQDLQNDNDKLNKIIEEQSQKVELLNEKDNKVKELMEQIQYLEKDTIQRSKFEKVQLLAEKKDEIITEKEKAIFEMQNTLETSKKSIKDLQQQVETFSLVKKDLQNKEDRIKELVLEIEKLTQKNKTNEEFINRIGKQLEESQEKSGNLTGKFELEIANLRHIIEDQTNQIKELKTDNNSLKNKLYESEQIEDRILEEMQKVKDSKIKIESDLEQRDQEIVELKKKIKLMRRDLKKS